MVSVYERVLGDDFKLLSPGLATFHSLSGTYHFRGYARVVGASNFLARLIVRLLGLPVRSSEAPVSFILAAAPEKESWIREFPHQTMRSTLHADAGFIIEHLGPVLLKSTLALSEDSLQMRIKEVSLWGIKLPAWCLPNVIADEVSSDNKLFFTIDVRWVWAGTLVGYSGFLDLSSMSEVTA